MHKNLMIYNELKELNSWLADISNTNVFTVPDGYFASLPSVIQHSIKDQYAINELDIPVLDMKVPEGYFDSLADEIMGKIRLEEAENSLEPAFLSTLNRKNVFTVPSGYFDGLAENILSKLPQLPAKVISMKPRSSIFRYAVAAGITGILGLSLFSLFDKRSNNIEITASATNTLAKIDQVFLKANEIIKNDSFDSNMEALGDDEIVSYLQNNGEDVNAALVASVTDEKTLPNADAYFIDEKALDNFLSEQNIVQTNNN